MTKIQSLPVVDEENPLWCSQVSADDILQLSTTDESFNKSFAFELLNAFHNTPDSSSSPHSAPHKATRPLAIKKKNLTPTGMKQTNCSPEIESCTSPQHPQLWQYSISPELASRKRKRHDESGRSGGSRPLPLPFKRINTDLSYDSTSFVLSEKAERLSFSAEAFQSSDSHHSCPHAGYLSCDQPSESISTLRPVQSPEIINLINKLDQMYPGARIAKRLVSASPESYQDVLNFLSEKGHLNYNSLALFRYSPVTAVALSKSLENPCGMLYNANRVLQAFCLPSSFTSLLEINLDHAQLCSQDINPLLGLGRLQSLSLRNTGIEDGAIFRLTALDSSLIFLTVSDNPDITDDCAPALILFSKLLDLDLKGTSITMHGIRRLCSAIDTEERDTYLHAPDKCYAYLDDLVSYYAVSIPPQYPMVDHPDQCPTLTRGSLEKNLSLHASFNSSIVTRGTRDVLIKSLQGILRTRMEDKQAEKVLYYPRRFVPKFPFQE